MKKEITLIIDGTAVKTVEGETVLRASLKAGIYIPHLCSHPALGPVEELKEDGYIYFDGDKIEKSAGTSGSLKCNLCIVESGSNGGLITACDTKAVDGMSVSTGTKAVLEQRMICMAQILSNHPHACILCASKDGCDRLGCSFNLNKNERCCDNFDSCELKALAEYTGVKQGIGKYSFKNLPAVSTPLFKLDYNLCIGCLRCVRACRVLQKNNTLGFIIRSGSVMAGTLNKTHAESGCVFCGACVSVCPAGALKDLGKSWPKKDGLKLPKPVPPPVKRFVFNAENVSKTPSGNGVFELFDINNKIILISGAASIRDSLKARLITAPEAKFFAYEENQMYTSRESELLQKFIKENGSLPELNGDNDLY